MRLLNDAYAAIRDAAGDSLVEAPTDSAGGVVQVPRQEARGSLSHDEIEAIIASMNARTTFWESVALEPLNRGAFLVVAAGHVVLLLPDLAGPGWVGAAPVASILTSLLFGNLLWSADSVGARLFIWLGYLFFALSLLPILPSIWWAIDARL